MTILSGQDRKTVSTLTDGERVLRRLEGSVRDLRQLSLQLRSNRRCFIF